MVIFLSGDWRLTWLPCPLSRREGEWFMTVVHPMGLAWGSSWR
jgi:hypothetical protein